MGFVVHKIKLSANNALLLLDGRAIKSLMPFSAVSH